MSEGDAPLSDADLTQLRKHAERTISGGYYMMRPSEAKALLARLDKAEAVCEWLDGPGVTGVPCEPLLAAWRSSRREQS